MENVERRRRTRVVVVGAGPSGAAAARVLTDAGAEVVVLERAAEPGGRTLTVRRGGFAVDSGAIFVMDSYRRTRAYLRHAGVERETRRWAARTAIRDRGRTFAVRFDLPHTFLRLPQLRWADRWRLARVIIGLIVRPGPGLFDLESLAASDNGESMETWSRRVLGDRVYEYVVRPLMEPLTGADLATISRSFLIALLRKPHRTRLSVPIGGMDRVTTWQLRDVDVRLGVQVKAVKRSATGLEILTSDELIEADVVIVATDAYTAADLCEDILPETQLRALRGVQAIPLHHVAFGFLTDPWPDAPHDLVVPVGLGRHSDIGVLLGERRRPGSTPPGGQVVSVYFDGPRSAQLAEDDLPREALQILREVHGSAEPDVTQVYYRPYGLSTAAPGHYRRMLNLLTALPHDVRLAGDYLTQSGIEGAYIAGERAAHDVLATLGSTTFRNREG